MTNGTEKYIETVSYLGKLYEFINQNLFKGELLKPVITVQVDSRNKSFGWWSTQKVWKESKDDEGAHELNVCAQFLNRSAEDIAETIIHEMCHQYASIHNLKDCSRSGKYHNKLFKYIAETHGLLVEKNDKSGWAFTSLASTTLELVKKFIDENPDKVIFRSPFAKGSVVKSSSTRKYICPVCQASVRATKAVNIKCADCDEYMVEE